MIPVLLFFGYYEHGDIILNYYISMLWAWSFSKLHLHQYLPLFFVVMKTNVNYQVIASFVLQDNYCNYRGIFSHKNLESNMGPKMIHGW